jgi:two-component system phosphate regulon sensor histidine kinase PhoR
LRRRIFISFIALIVIFAALSAGLMSAIMATVIPQQVINRLQSEIDLLIPRMKQLGDENVMRELLSLSRVTHIAPDGTVLFDNNVDADPLENHRDRDEVKQALSQGTGSAVRYSDTLDANMIYVASRLEDGSVLRLAAFERASMEMMYSMLPWQIFGVIGLIILCLPLAAWLTDLLIKPIVQINLDKPEENDIYDEVMPLVSRIDEQVRVTRKQMQALENRRQELNVLLDGMHEGFIALDRRQRVMLINPSASDMLGIDRNWAIGKTMPELNRRQEMLALLNELEQNGSAQAMMVRGGRSYVMSASRVESHQGAVLLISDQTEKLEGDALRKRFTANVSHELRTPLTTICGYAEMFEKSMVKPEDIPGFSRVILRESKRMLTLVEDILRLSKLDEGFPRGNREKVGLHEVAKAACESLEPMAREKEIDLSFEGEEAFIQGDRTLLGELCMNLIDNAIKYNYPKGTVQVSVTSRDNHAIFKVADTGIGIEPEHHSRIFERFYRTDKSRSKATGGTGLGLSIVKHAAEYHSGKISLDSAPGKGTTISVAFPLFKAKDAPIV